MRNEDFMSFIEFDDDIIYFPVIVRTLDYLYSFMLTMAFAVIVVLLMHIKIHRINMSDSLKSIE